jgi:hypothetical protein
MIITLPFSDTASLSSVRLLTCPAYKISARIAQKLSFLSCNTNVVVETCLFAEPLLRNGYSIFAYFVIVV